MILKCSILFGVILLHVSSQTIPCPSWICIQTQNVLFAGTDEDVYVKLFGDSGRTSPWIFIDDPKEDDFEQSSFKCYDVVSLRQFLATNEIVKVGARLLGDRTTDSGWDLAFITVLYHCQCRTYDFSLTLDAFDPAQYRKYIGYCRDAEKIIKGPHKLTVELKTTPKPG